MGLSTAAGTNGVTARDGSFSGSGPLRPDALLDILAQVPAASPFFARASHVLDKVLAPSGHHARPAPRASKFLTVAMATYDDYDGVYFTVQSVRLFHPEVADEIDFLVLDNHPEGPASDALRKLCDWIPDLRYLPYTRIRGTAVRDVLYRESTSAFVLCVDSHVLIPPGALSRLIAYLKTHRDTRDMLQGPLLYDDLRNISTHLAPEWRGGMFGTWATDARGADPDAEPFEIPMQGLGLFVCRRNAWPGFNPRLYGFGGEEGYVHEKVRRAGGRVLCLPFLRWMHRFGRPHGVGYQNTWQDRIRNYGIIYDELGWDRAPMLEHFRELVGVEPTDRAASSLALELASPFHHFDAIYCVGSSATDRGVDATKRFEQLGIASRVRRADAIETPSDPAIGRALSQRAILDEADRHGFQNVLVLHEASAPCDEVLDELPRCLGEMVQQRWWTLTLGEGRMVASYDTRRVRQALQKPCSDLARLNAIVYNRPAFGPLLAELPDTPSLMALWVRRGREARWSSGYEPAGTAICPA